MKGTRTEEQPDSASEPIRLVLVEDDEEDAIQLRMALHGAEPGYDVAVARTLDEAMSREDADDFELVLCDLGLPDSRGLDTFSRCKARWPDKPIVILSGLEDERLAEEAVQAGAQDYLVKWTSSRPALRRALRYAFERHRTATRGLTVPQVQDQRRRLEAVGRLAAGVAHEINTPLQFVGDNMRFLDGSFRDLMGAVRRIGDALGRAGEVEAKELDRELRQVLEDADVDYLAEEVPNAIAESLEGLDRVREVVQSMKELASPRETAMALVDVNRRVLAAVTIAASDWKPVAEVETELDPDLPDIPCVPGDVHRALLDLLVNAAQAIASEGRDSPGRIVLRTGRVEGFVEIRVSDDGPGIPGGIRDRIFEPFFTTRDVGQGRGHGLTRVHSIVVEQHGGSVAVESEPGAGATFVVRLPIEPASDG